MNNKNPKISVIIPAYNRAYCLGETIDSVLAQTYRDYELIVVDDGSTDNTHSLVQAVRGIKYLRIAENSGVSMARNLGIRNARGKYICFLDSDDLWVNTKLEQQALIMEVEPVLAACYTDEIWVRNGVRVNSGNRHKKYSGRIFRYCLPLCIISPSSVMLRAEIFAEIGMFDETLPACEDYDYWLRLTARFPVRFLSQKLIVKRGGHPDQLSGKFEAMDRFRVYALDKALKHGAMATEERPLAIRTLIDKCGVLLNGCIKREKTDEVRFYRDLMEKYSLELVA